MSKNRKSLRNILILLIIAVPAIIVTYFSQKQNVNDSFESGHLSHIWSTTRMEKASIEFEHGIFQKGKSAIKITLRNGDKVEINEPVDKDTERDELLESRYLYAHGDSKYEYKFSMFLPEDFPVVPVRLVLAQWKQDCPFCECNGYSPVVALRYVSGRLFITLQTDSTRHELFSMNEEIRDRWLDFRFIIKFSKSNNGELNVFMNDKELVNYKGITSYSDDCRYLSSKDKYYFKMGLYRDRMTDPMAIYIDDYSKRKIN